MPQLDAARGRFGLGWIGGGGGGAVGKIARRGAAGVGAARVDVRDEVAGGTGARAFAGEGGHAVDARLGGGGEGDALAPFEALLVEGRALAARSDDLDAADPFGDGDLARLPDEDLRLLVA